MSSLVPKFGFRVEDGEYIPVPFPSTYSPWRHTLQWRYEISNWHVQLKKINFDDATVPGKIGFRVENGNYIKVDWPHLYSAWNHVLRWNADFENWEIRFRNLPPKMGYRVVDYLYCPVAWPDNYSPWKHKLIWNEDKCEWVIKDRDVPEILNRWRLDRAYIDLRYNIGSFETVDEFLKAYSDPKTDFKLITVSMKKEKNNSLIQEIMNLN